MTEEIAVNNREKVKLLNHSGFTELIVRNYDSNIIDIEVLQDLISAFGMLTPDTSFIVIRSGGENFSKGFDTSCIRVKETEFMKEIQDLSFVLRRMIESIGRPVFAFVNGFCLGLGFEIALSCDHIFSSPDAKFGFPDSKFGLPPLSGIFERIIQEYGKPVSDLFLTGEVISSEDPRTGLFSTQINEKNFVDAALSHVEEINGEIVSYYKGKKKLDAGNPEAHLFRILDPQKIRLKELEAFRDSL